MNELTNERLEKRIKNCIEVGNSCVMLPVSVAEELLAYRKASQSVTAITTEEEMLHVTHGSNGQIFAECRADDFEHKGLQVIKLYASPVLPKQPEQYEVSQKRLEVIGYGSVPASISEQRSMARALLSAQLVSEPYKLDGWISVDEKMPETTRKDQYFITYRRHNKNFKSVTGGFSIDIFRKGCFCFPAVTHWMPLPAAPAQESK